MKIQPRPVGTASVSVPGSKSLSHRFLAAAALSDGDCIIENCLISEDTLLTMDGLRQMGVTMRVAGEQIQVRGKNGRFSACQQPVYLGNSGTSLRFFCALAALGRVYTPSPVRKGCTNAPFRICWTVSCESGLRQNP